ncbi:MAG: hypothetical protein J7L25_00580 [Deltaproteobacteria bacterium]|nr:hypothetical protein [Candidatus Tharpella aukensis]
MNMQLIRYSTDSDCGVYWGGFDFLPQSHTDKGGKEVSENRGHHSNYVFLVKYAIICYIEREYGLWFGPWGAESRTYGKT